MNDVLTGNCEPPWTNTPPEWASKPSCCASLPPNPTLCLRCLVLLLWRTWYVLVYNRFNTLVSSVKTGLMIGSYFHSISKLNVNFLLQYEKTPRLVELENNFNVCPAGEEVQRHDVRGSGERSRRTRPRWRRAGLRAAPSHHRRHPSFCRQDDPGQIQCDAH